MYSVLLYSRWSDPAIAEGFPDYISAFNWALRIIDGSNCWETFEVLSLNNA